MTDAAVDLEQRARDGFRFQAGFAEMMASPITRRVCLSVAEALNRDSRTGRTVLAWPGDPIRDAMPLRLVGGLHALAQKGDPELGELFAGAGDDPVGIVRRALMAHDAALLPWLDGPPQTNEAARSAALMVGLLEVAKRHGPRLELLEIGSSAGLNLLIDRYPFELDGVSVGPVDIPLRLRPTGTARRPRRDRWRSCRYAASTSHLSTCPTRARSIGCAAMSGPTRRSGWSG